MSEQFLLPFEDNCSIKAIDVSSQRNVLYTLETIISRHMQKYELQKFWQGFYFYKEKSRLRETLILSMCEDSSTDTKINKKRTPLTSSTTLSEKIVRSVAHICSSLTSTMFS